MTLYYDADGIQLWHADCREIDAWLTADVLVTDPPYGIGWTLPELASTGTGHRSQPTQPHAGIRGDNDTSTRDDALKLWGDRPAMVFGSPQADSPNGTRQVVVWQKPESTGIFGSIAGFRRDWEAIYLLGNFPASPARRSGVIRTNGNHVDYLKSGAGHPHTKPTALLEVLIQACPPGVIADPFAGSGSTLIAARNLGRKAIGVELEERYCEITARRLAQGCLDFGEGA